MLYNKIFSDKLIEKLKKIPVFVWYIIFGLSSLFASAYALKATSNEVVTMVKEMVPEINVNAVLIMSYPMLMLIEIVIFEFIAYLVYSVFYRFRIKMTQYDFIFRLRLILICAYLIIRLLSLIYFAFPQAAPIGSAIINVSVTTILLGFLTFAICKDFIPNNKQAEAYKFIARIYLGINIVMSLISFSMLFAFDDSLLVEYLQYGIRLFILMLLSVWAYFQYLKLRKLPPEEPKIDDKQEKRDDNVYKDFGF
jgi:hypothetical protein